MFREKAATLAAALEHDDQHDAARQALRGFLDRIVIPPGAGLLQVVGNFGAMLATAEGRKAGLASGVGYVGCGGPQPSLPQPHHPHCPLRGGGMKRHDEAAKSACARSAQPVRCINSIRSGHALVLMQQPAETVAAAYGQSLRASPLFSRRSPLGDLDVVGDLGGVLDAEIRTVGGGTQDAGSRTRPPEPPERVSDRACGQRSTRTPPEGERNQRMRL
jgi:hypothetical protein